MQYKTSAPASALRLDNIVTGTTQLAVDASVNEALYEIKFAATHMHET